jgi:hypothetical protein
MVIEVRFVLSQHCFEMAAVDDQYLEAYSQAAKK